MTVIPVLAGFVPGVTVTVKRVVAPGLTAFGFAAPVPDGLVLPPHELVGDALLRGMGAPVAKSVEF